MESELRKILKVKCRDFLEGEIIPSEYCCTGKNINPEIIIEDIPENAKTLVLIVEDPDAPAGLWVHWLVFNIPVSGKIMRINKDSIPGEEGMNDFKITSYKGPCPPQGMGFHRYFFKVFALDTRLSLSFATRQDIELAMRNHILAKGEIFGIFKR